MDTMVRGAGTEVIIGPGRPKVVIGNRIDAAADEKIAAALKRMDLTPLAEEARAQARDGADLIDVRVGLKGIDEAEALPAAVRAVAEAVPLPICITTQNPRALKAALEVCPGKPLINAVTAEEKSISELLPLALAWETAVITLGFDAKGLPFEFKGLPFQFDEPFELHRNVLRKALSAGIPRGNVMIGISAGAVADDPGSAASALDLITRLARMEQLNVALEPRKVTRGLPDQDLHDQVFLVAAMMRGVTCAFVDPLVFRKVFRAVDRLFPPGGGADQRDSTSGA